VPRSPGRRDALAVVAVVVLLAAAVPGANAVAAAWRSGSARRGPGGLLFPLVEVLAVVVALAAAGIVVAVVGRVRRSRPDGQVVPVPQAPEHSRWARLVAAIVAVLAIAAPFVGLAVVRHLRAGPAAPVTVPGVEVSPGRGTGSTAPPAHPGGLVVVAVFGLAAIVLLALVVWSARRRVGQPIRPGRSGATALAEAAAAGSAALSGDDPRTAVLRCYAVMATELRRAGVAGRASDVPGELLARAAARGAVPAEPAGELTDLFGAARYSSRPVTEAHRQAAAAALARIRARARELS
jgi:hypothetical protein